jgi:transmembrane sensor
MKNNLENRDDLIAKVLAGEASREEIDLLEDWMDESEENKKYFDLSKKLFSQIDRFKAENKVDTVKAWEKLNSRISESETKVIPLFKRPVIRAAASILLIMALALIANYVMNNSVGEPVVLVTTQTMVEKKLPDGSKVFLNKNSELTYVLNKFNVREVKLQGEAYFEVKHNEEQPFIISVGSIVIKDIGTSFNVKAIPGANTIEVFVESGEVQFYYRNNNNAGLNLVKGEKAVYVRNTGRFHKFIPDPLENTMSYKSRIFHFKGVSLKEVITEVNMVYGSNIQLSNGKLGDCHLSVVFNNENLEELVSIIAETLDLQVEHAGDTILLKGQPCNQ